jgi:transcriptional regulator of acetoin/glycerol metabolism
VSKRPEDTASASWEGLPDEESLPSPGIVLIFSGSLPRLTALDLREVPEVLGRESMARFDIGDSRLSRRHAELSFASGCFVVRDLGSRNGTFVDGQPVRGEVRLTSGILRVGDTVLLLSPDIRPYAGRTVFLTGGTVIGPALHSAWQEIQGLACHADSLHIYGETGVGKELAARHFHESTGRTAGPFVAVNCATIPAGLAERLLFGTRRGAYSGADQDAEGYLQAADGGTLFFDEIAELDLAVQAKLLRVLESQEVLPLGATRGRKVDVRVCSASHRELHAEVAARRFREDLHYRIGLRTVRIPPLRERLAEIPWLVQSMVAGAPGELKTHASLVEAVLLRHWPGNVRELATAIVQAAQAAREKREHHVRSTHLPAGAGMVTGDSPSIRRATSKVSRESIEEALNEANGNITVAAKRLGLHRTQLRRLMTRYNVSVGSFRDE